MPGLLFGVFLDVVVPVFGLVALGYVVGPRLKLEARTLSRVAFYLFVPAFVFDVISRTPIDPGSASRMAGFVLLSSALFSLLGWLAARALGCSRHMTAAFIMTATFGNVGNFGLALVNFRLGPEGLAPATIFFVLINIVAFGTCVVVAAWARGGGARAILSVFKTPGLVAVIPAALVAWGDVALPATVTRSVGLLSQAMIPVMLLALGIQLAGATSLKITREEVVATGLRLLAAPALAWATIGWFGITGMDRAAGIIQCGMPVAVLVSIVSIEYDVAPDFVTSTVFFSTLCSLPTLTLLLAIV